VSLDAVVLLAAMAGGGLLTFASRVVFLLAGERVALGPRLRTLLTYVPPAVLSALVAPEVFVRDGALLLSAHNPRLWAAAVAVLVAWRTRSVLATIGIGLATLWALQAAL
jgi:branched-subunit amino acid transport protein